ncbi:MAG TPA: hypothetical protein PKN33_08650 [Phycisphaerae bacterium]|nr:hypothetical protein [Phycisphaerae bacterium]
MQKLLPTIVIVAGLLFTCGCKPSDKTTNSSSSDSAATHTDTSNDSHDSATSETTKDDHAKGEGHAHDEVSLGKVKIGDHEVELAQGHGKIKAGKEGHLVVKLPYNDKGETIVRAWLGSEDRTLSVVSKGEYAPSHDDYDVHAVAPDLLPENVMWWIEIEKPDGTKLVCSMKPSR